ncbi:hypothetical protein V7S43_015023 [Phytophthora oleae]|uniref:Shugoshin C-terminal domain-containing protein n=1 Tax=Phytophthora oleae TaxID=2107226 RepID=A0ABD3F0P9_9STRA
MGKVNGGVAASMAKEKCTSGGDIAKQSDGKDAGDAVALNKVVVEVKTMKHNTATARAEKLWRKQVQAEQIKANVFQASVTEVDTASSVPTQTKAASAPSKDAAIMSFTSSVVPAKSSKMRSLPVQQYMELSRESSLGKDVMSSSSTQTSATESSRPREWGKRKRLVTRKRGEAGKAPVSEPVKHHSSASNRPTKAPQKRIIPMTTRRLMDFRKRKVIYM